MHFTKVSFTAAVLQWEGWLAEGRTTDEPGSSTRDKTQPFHSQPCGSTCEGQSTIKVVSLYPGCHKERKNRPSKSHEDQ